MHKLNPPLNFLPNIREEGYNKKTNKAFTLVELIVVITILAILWTISFISLQWYSTDARDSTRISDISTMRSSLELYNLDAGKYPLPTNWVSVTYSGSVVWKQWTFWETVYANLSKLDKIPKDALTDKEYTYSVINKQNEYELAWLLEGDTISLNLSQPSLKLGKEQNKANAWTVEAKAYTTWNYNGTMAKSLSWTTCSMIWIPTIIANDVTTTTDLSQIVTNKWLVYNGYKNLPSSFKESKFKHDWWFDFTTSQLIAYTDTWSCEALTAKTNSWTTARVQLLQWLQNSYSGTLVQSVWEIQNIVALTINTSSPSSEVIAYGANFVNNTLWADIIVNAVTSVSSSSSWGGWNTTCTSWQGWNWTACVTATECTTWLESITLSNWQTWSCKNLWATTVRDWTTAPIYCAWTVNNCNLWNTWIWDYYQWWKNDTTFTNALNTWFWSNWDWQAPQNNDAWWNITDNPAGTNTSARQWPCSSWWHVPSQPEWLSACNLISWTSCADNVNTVNSMKSKLKLPSAGWRHWANWNYYDQAGVWYYRSSTNSWLYAYTLRFLDNFISTTELNWRSYGYSVRCIKN